jgi:endonuclease/exonuclease/phosphatase family metal-dependent hydrolase
MRLFEKLADQTGYTGRTTKRSIIGGDLNLPYADQNGHVKKSRGTQAFLNRLVWENGYTQVVNSPTQGDALLDVYLVQHERAFTSCHNVQGISDHYGVLLEVEWVENCHKHQVERLVPVYHKTNVTGLQISSGVNSHHGK